MSETSILAALIGLFCLMFSGCAGKRFVASDCAYVGAQASPSEWVCSPQKK